MDKGRINWLVLGTLLLGVPFIYEFNIHPLFGFLTGFLVSWLIIEDFFEKMIDLRVSGSLLILILVWNHMKDWSHFVQAFTTFLGFTLSFYVIRLIFVKFIPLEKYMEEQDRETDTPFDYLDNLQEGASVGLVPLMGLATYLVLMIDMVFNPVQMVLTYSGEGASWAGGILRLHLSLEQLGIYLGENMALLTCVLCSLGMFLCILILRIRRRILNEKQLPFYPCGAGDPLVIGIFAAMVGAECFYLAVMMLTFVLGIMVHGFRAYKGRRI